MKQEWKTGWKRFNKNKSREQDEKDETGHERNKQNEKMKDETGMKVENRMEKIKQE